MGHVFTFKSVAVQTGETENRVAMFPAANHAAKLRPVMLGELLIGPPHG
jgi:hypothetical protein